MRRVAVFLAVVSLFVFGSGFGVNAESPGSRAPAAEQPTTTVGDDLLHELRRIKRMAPNVQLCNNITANTPVSQLTNCLNRVTKFAKATQRELDALDRFVGQYLSCTRYVQVTQYGDPLGSQGYVYDPGTGVTFRTTSLDITIDVATDPFLNYTVLKPTNNCVKFAN